MSGEVTKESERLGSWGVLGQGTGAQLMDGGKILTREQVTGN